jgi:hypothetical protein
MIKIFWGWKDNQVIDLITTKKLQKNRATFEKPTIFYVEVKLL